jgi:AAA domain
VKNASPSVLSLARLLEQQPAAAPACLVEPGLLPPQSILFVGGEPKVGKSLLVANLALSLAAGVDRIGFPIPAPCAGLPVRASRGAVRQPLGGHAPRGGRCRR